MTSPSVLTAEAESRRARLGEALLALHVISPDDLDRALAEQRAQGMYIFSIGLGSTVDTTFLRQIANDPASPTFNPALPVGATLTTTNAADLTIIFHSIASKILSF